MKYVDFMAWKSTVSFLNSNDIIPIVLTLRVILKLTELYMACSCCSFTRAHSPYLLLTKYPSTLGPIALT